MEGPAFRWGCQNLIPVSGRLLCGPVDVSGMRFSRVGEISWEALRDVNGLDQGCGGGDAEERVCLKVEPTGPADVGGEGRRNLG